MTITSIVTKQGKLDTLRATFNTQNNPAFYGWLGIGIADQDLDEDSTLLSECNPADGYQRVLTNRTINELTQTITLEGVFERNNVATSTTIRTVGVTNTEIIGDNDPWFCLCKIPPIVKTDQLALSVVINVQVL